MQGVELREVNKGDALLDQVELLFKRLYEFLAVSGMQMPMVEGGEKLWRQSAEKLIGGRFGVLVAAVKNGNAVGFAHGVLRYAPDYLGGLKVGFITNIYVDPTFRTGGIGRRLIDYLENWFRVKGTHSCELQVLAGNTSGLEFWTRCGFSCELFQMRKRI
jgi:GNAT superfamily N-acetyltransferase